MPISTISQIISTIPEAGRRGVDVQTTFVTKQEDFQDHLQGTTVSELNALKTQINTTVTGINDAVTNVNTKASEADADALSASNSAGVAANKAGEASTSASQASTSATKASQWADSNYNVEVEAGKYSAKHWATEANNVVNNKVDKNISTYTEKTTPVNADLLPLSDSASSFGIKKLSWSNIKETLKTYFDSLYMVLTGDQTISGNKNFNNKVLIASSDGILGYANGFGVGGQVTQGSSSGKTTPVVLNKPSGSLIMNNAALASQVSIYFTISNTKFLASDGVIITQNDNGSYLGTNYDIKVVYKADGLIGISVKNLSPSTLSDAVIFRFDLIRGTNS